MNLTNVILVLLIANLIASGITISLINFHFQLARDGYKEILHIEEVILNITTHHNATDIDSANKDK